MIKIGMPQFKALENNISFKGKEMQINNVSSYINTDRMVDSFVKMAKVDTGSNEELAETKTPSTESQRGFAGQLAEELKKLNLKDIEIDENAILTATLPSNIGDDPDLPVVGLLAHMDTSNSVPTGPVNPQIHKYTGGDIELKEGTVIPASDLKGHEGQNIITSDGTTLLGADDKAGIAEILEAIRVFNEHPELKHPKIRIAFTPDEETGMGISKFDIKKFGADIAYTVDGEAPSDLETATFNAFNPEITIQGKNIHPGDAYGKMINSIEIANEFMQALPPETPSTTKDEQGYFHVKEIKGNVSQTKLSMLVRDFDYGKELERVEFLRNVVKQLEDKYPDCKINFDPKPRYRNMKEKLQELPEVTEYAKEGIRRSGLNPEEKSIRGGTDGSQLTLRNLLTPNLGAGGVNFHSKNEFVSAQDMKKATENVINILSVWADKAKEIAPKIIERRNNAE